MTTPTTHKVVATVRPRIPGEAPIPVSISYGKEPEVKQPTLKNLPPHIFPHNDRYICSVCEVDLSSGNSMYEHIRGRKHVAGLVRLEELERQKHNELNTRNTHEPTLPNHIVPYKGLYKCKICHLPLNSMIMVNEHAGGRRHAESLKTSGDSACIAEGKRHDELNTRQTSEPTLPNHIVPYKGLYKCKICHLPLNSMIMVNEHAAGRRHAESLKISGDSMAEGQKPESSAHVQRTKLAVDQNISYNKPKQAFVPLIITTTSEDQPNAEREEKQKLPRNIIPFGTQYKCQICKLKLASLHMVIQHTHGKRHIRTHVVERLYNQRDMLLRDKCGVTVDSISPVEGKKKEIVELTMNFQEEINAEDVPFTVCNKNADSIKVYNIAFLRDRPYYKLVSTVKPSGINPVAIAPGGSLSFQVKARPIRIGRFHTTLIIRFRRDEEPDEDIYILREIRARAVNDVVLESDPKVAYMPPIRISFLPENEVIDGERPKSGRIENLEKKLELKNYGIKKIARSAVNHGLDNLSHRDPAVNQELLRIRSLWDDEKAPSTQFQEYHSRLSTLLHLEELQMEVDIRTYDMSNVTMKRDGKLLELWVPGLAENRPSVLKGDHIFVKIIGKDKQPEDTEYKGYVHDVKLESVLLGNNRLIAKFIDNMKFNVRFTFTRLPMRLQHRATELAVDHGLERLLYPQRDTACRWGCIMDPMENLRFYDRNIEANNEQATAVRHILAGSSRPAPYLIFGPPGTGKTVTVVETIKQVLQCIPGAHVLACAPSNSAADLITQRVAKHVSKNDIFRMYAVSRNWSAVPEDIREVSNYDRKEREFFYPSKEDICKKKLVVVTLVTAGRLASASFPPNHFTHVFIDEAGHAFESEAMISVAGVMKKDGGQLVLAGDPKQLGPIVRSPWAKEYGLEMSLLERLMSSIDPFKRPEGEDSHYDTRLITKLVDNYRSHPQILDPPNKLFYNGELRVCADKLVREAFCQWEELPKKDFPIIFHGVVGKEVREGNSPSFFNPEEISYVDKYVQKLMNARGVMKLKESDIGIIAPYRQQVGTKSVLKVYSNVLKMYSNVEISYVVKYVEKLMNARGVMKLKESDIGIIAPYRQQVVKIRKIVQKKGYKNIKVGSVEEFQGQERMVIIISTVRSRPEYLDDDLKYKLGFLANAKKFNVATTRAKALMIVIGNPEILQLDSEKCWNKLIDHCIDNGGYIGHEFVPLEEDVEQMNKKMSELKLGDYITGDKKQLTNISDIQSKVEPEWRGENTT